MYARGVSIPMNDCRSDEMKEKKPMNKANKLQLRGNVHKNWTSIIHKIFNVSFSWRAAYESIVCFSLSHFLIHFVLSSVGAA